MYNYFYKFLESFRESDSTLVEAIGTGFRAIYEVFDRGGDLNYMGDGVVDITLSDGTNFIVDVNKSETLYETAKGTKVLVIAPLYKNIRDISFKTYNSKYSAYTYAVLSADGAERDPAVMEGVIAVVRAYAEFDPNTASIDFNGISDESDDDSEIGLEQNMYSSSRKLLNTINASQNIKSRLGDKINIYVRKIQNSEIDVDDVINILDDDFRGIEKLDEDAFNEAYKTVIDIIKHTGDILKKGKTRRDRAYILMIKRRDRNADISFDGIQYHYNLSPELMQKKASNPDLKKDSD